MDCGSAQSRSVQFFSCVEITNDAVTNQLIRAFVSQSPKAKRIGDLGAAALRVKRAQQAYAFGRDAIFTCQHIRVIVLHHQELIDRVEWKLTYPSGSFLGRRCVVRETGV